MEHAYKFLASRLDELPNGFPPTEDGVELRLLEKLFMPEEAELAARLRLTLETSDQVAERLGEEPTELRDRLKTMARKGLIAAGRVEGGVGYGLLPFVVGIYELHGDRIDAELARLFEDYFLQAFGKTLEVEPAVHRVIPVGESVRMDIEIQPYESAAEIVENAQAWGVLDCICRKQKALVGEPCDHPLDVCLTFSQKPGAFEGSQMVRSLSREGALETLQRAARAGLVHSVSNNRHGMSYICNCCTCSCGVLRGLADLGIANVVARSAFVNTVDETLCIACEDCMAACQFGAISMGDLVVTIDEMRCVGCGVCALACTEQALSLVRRPVEQVKPIPENELDWMRQRAAARGLDLELVS